MIASSTSRDDPQTFLPVALASIVLVLVVRRPSSLDDLKADCANVAVVEPYRTWGLVIGL